MIKDDIKNLKETDIYSIMLFTLYRLTPTSQYSALSELVYVLDKENLLNLCEYFGGTTITIPTVEQLRNVINAMVLYSEIKIKNRLPEECFKEAQQKYSDFGAVKRTYQTICKVMEDYEIGVN